MKAPGAILALALGPKGKAAKSEDEAAEPEAEESSGDYKTILADAAKAGDWESFAEAVEGIARSCASKEPE